VDAEILLGRPGGFARNGLSSSKTVVESTVTRTHFPSLAVARFRVFPSQSRLLLLKPEPDNSIKRNLPREELSMIQGQVAETSNTHLFECYRRDRVGALPKGILER